MSVEYYGHENDPHLKIREEIRRNPLVAKALFAEAQQTQPELTFRGYLFDIGFEDTEVANLLNKI